MEIILAILTGIAGGIVGVIPFMIARARIKAKMKKDGIGGIAIGMVAAFISFILLAAEIVLCHLLAAEYLLPYSISSIVIFLLAMGAYTAILMRR